MDKYQHSHCLNGYLHNYVFVREYPKGFLERCKRCKKTIFFPLDVPNYVYLSHHIRSAIQQDDPRFIREYGQL